MPVADTARHKKSGHCRGNDRIYQGKEKDRICGRLFLHLMDYFFIELLVLAYKLADQAINGDAWIMHRKSLIVNLCLYQVYVPLFSFFSRS